MVVNGYDWDAAARRFGIGRDGRFNSGTIAIPHPRALVWVDEDGREQVFSGADLQAYARRVAGALAAAGVRRGDRVASVLGRRPESLVAPLALWQLGAIYVPLFSGFRGEAIATRIEDSGARLVLTDPANRDNVAGAQERLGDLEAIMVAGAGRDGDRELAALLERAVEVAPADSHAEDPATIVYTSGTTGRPKGCVIPHRALLTLWPFMEAGMAVSADDVLFSTADTGWSFGLFTTGLAPLSRGGSRILYAGPFETAAWWRLIRERGVTHLASAPTGFRQLALAEPDVRGGGGALAAATSAGEQLNPEIVRWWQEHEGLTIHDAYGLTELGIVVANLRTADAPAPLPRSAGTAVPGFDVRVIDAAGDPLPPGEEGRIAVRDHGYLFTSTYWGRDAEWDACLRDGWWVTQDIASCDEHGQLWYRGRDDDVIVTAGYNVGPTEVEEVLLTHPLVTDVACVAEPDERKGSVVAAHVVIAGTAPDDLRAQLAERVGEALGWHAAPRRLHLHDELPRTESGKVKRNELRQRGAPARDA